jgi:hypothetical protein
MFYRIDKSSSIKPHKWQKENIDEFPIFLVRNYLELIQKNGWVAKHLKETLGCLTTEFCSGTNATVYTKQFYRMMQIELAAVVDDYMKMIEKEHRYGWRDMYKNKGDEKLVKDTSYIKDFFRFEHNKSKLIDNINKYEVVKSVLNLSDNWFEENSNGNSEFVNYLWIKQLLYADCIDKDPQLPKTIGYQEKIDAIIEKMKRFFPKDSKVQAFFVVTDGQNRPYSLYNNDNYVLNRFEDNYKDTKFPHLQNFLDGQQDKQRIARVSIAEYTIKDDTQNEWNDLYNIDGETAIIEYLPENAKWLLLVRISQFDNEKFKTMGVLGFYTIRKNDEEAPNGNNIEYLLPKQLLMLLRRDMSAFINKHHKNDEFSESIRQREKNKYVFQLNHGVNGYKNTIKELLKLCKDTHLKDDLRSYYNYLITKLDIISKLSSEEKPLESITLREIKLKFYKIHWKALSLNTNISTPIQYFPKKDIPSLVKLRFIGFEDEKKQYCFPKNCIEDIIFELLNNVRKNTYNMNIDSFTSINPLTIDVAIMNEGDVQFLSVTNNHVSNPYREPQKDNKPHGIDLLKQIWNTYGLGKIIPDTYPLKNDSFTIKIQIKPNNGK